MNTFALGSLPVHFSVAKPFNFRGNIQLVVLFVEPFDFVVHNQSTECFVVLCCHNTFAKSYGSKVGLIFKNVAFLLPFLLHSSYRFRCTTVTIYVAPWLPFLLHFSIPVTTTPL